MSLIPETSAGGRVLHTQQPYGKRVRYRVTPPAQSA
jgi:hypothetical protein